MSTTGKRDYRPAWHFTPPEMWMNDPNGMFYADGFYHLFYQKYPEDTVWGPMYWGHAKSRDLLHWEHLPIALYPDDLGYAFSGSCVYDWANVSGYGKPENPAVIALYTSHDSITGLEHQCLAYSTDGGIHFEKSYLNPVIENPGITDFRDPKVFANPFLGGYSLVVAAGDRVRFYASRDLKNWELTGEFGAAENRASGVFECPDLFTVKAGGKTLWVLLVSMTTTVADGKSRTQYFVGDFDGRTFSCTEPSAVPLWVDFGFDHYAGVTFQNLPEPVCMAWAMNWGYADSVPTGAFCSQMTLGRRLSLKKAGNRHCLASVPVGLEPYRHGAYPLANQARLTGESFGLLIKGRGAAQLTLKNSRGQELIIGFDHETIMVDRSRAGESGFHEQFAMAQYQKAAVPRLINGAYHAEVVFDVSILEVFADEGLLAGTFVVYPETPYDQLEWQGELQVEMYLLK